MSKLALSFNNTQFHVVKRNSQIWLTASEISKALGYKNDNAVSRIYARNADEFSATMSQKVKLTLSGNYQKESRIFSLRGAHLIGMFARTSIAKDFRKWVLDILDKETSNKNTVQENAQISADMINLKCLCSHMTWLNGWWSRYQDAVRGFNRIVAASVHDHFNDGAFVAAQFIGKYSLDVVPSKVARNFPWDANDQEKHDYYTLTRNEKR